MYAAPNRRTAHRLVGARRADAVVAARARRVPGHVRARVGDGRARRRLRASTRSSCGSRNEPDVDPETGPPFSSRNLVACLREGAERFGWERRDPTPGRAPRRPLAARHRRGRLDLPRLPDAAAAAAASRRRRRATSCASPPPTSAPARARCSRRSPPTRSSVPARAVARRDRRQRASRAPAWPAARRAPRRGARRSCWRAARCASSSPSTAARCPPTASRRPPHGEFLKSPRAARRARLRRAVRRGARRRRHRRGPRVAHARRVRRRAHHQPAHGALAVPRRHDDGHLDGAARGERHGRALRRLRQPRPRRSTTSPSSADIERIEAHWIDEARRRR